MKSNSMTVTLARVAGEIERTYVRGITKVRLLMLLGEHSVHQEAVAYIDKMLDWGWIYYDHVKDVYHLTDAGRQTSTIRITVPRLLSKEARRHLVEKLATYGDIFEVGEVENDD